MYITAQGPHLQNDLYCVEWDVKLYYTIPYQRGRSRKAWQEVVDKVINDLHLKLSDCYKWRKMIRGN